MDSFFKVWFTTVMVPWRVRLENNYFPKKNFLKFTEQNKMQVGIIILIYHTEPLRHNSTATLSMFPITWIYQGENPAGVDRDSELNSDFLFLLAW